MTGCPVCCFAWRRGLSLVLVAVGLASTLEIDGGATSGPAMAGIFLPQSSWTNGGPESDHGQTAAQNRNRRGLSAACDFDPPAAKELRAAICATGQVARLELQSKIDNLIVPNNASAALDIFLVLQDESEATFTSAKPGVNSGACVDAPADLKEAARVLGEHARVFTHVQPRETFAEPNPDLWPKLFSPGGRPTTVMILQTIMHQISSWKSCGEAVMSQEAEAGIRYDMVLRIRDNSLVVLPYNLHSALLRSGTAPGSSTEANSGSCIPPPRAVTKSCSGTKNGYSDKVMLVPREHLEGALLAPMAVFSESLHHISYSNSPEHFLKGVMDHMRVPVGLADAESLPITDGRCEKGKNCLVISKKDCRPLTVPLSKPWPICSKTYLLKRRAAEAKMILT